MGGGSKQLPLLCLQYCAGYHYFFTSFGKRRESSVVYFQEICRVPAARYHLSPLPSLSRSSLPRQLPHRADLVLIVLVLFVNPLHSLSVSPSALSPSLMLKIGRVYLVDGVFFILANEHDNYGKQFLHTLRCMRIVSLYSEKNKSGIQPSSALSSSPPLSPLLSFYPYPQPPPFSSGTLPRCRLAPYLSCSIFPFYFNHLFFFCCLFSFLLSSPFLSPSPPLSLSFLFLLIEEEPMMCYPLTAVVDVLGFRVLALASLPLRYIFVLFLF